MDSAKDPTYAEKAPRNSSELEFYCVYETKRGRCRAQCPSCVFWATSASSGDERVDPAVPPEAVALEESLAGRVAYYEAIFQACEDADFADMVFWRPGPDHWRALAICSDTFWWATADCEEVTPEDVPLLQQCITDLQAIEREGGPNEQHRNDSVATAYVPQLYAARKRKLRPMRTVYEDGNAIGPRVAALFDAAGPKRDDV